MAFALCAFAHRKANMKIEKAFKPLRVWRANPYCKQNYLYAVCLEPLFVVVPVKPFAFLIGELIKRSSGSSERKQTSRENNINLLSKRS